MKNYSFERVYGTGEEEKVEIRQNTLHSNLKIKIFCVILAFAFWLVVSAMQIRDERKNNGNPNSTEKTDTVQAVQEEDLTRAAI